MSIENVTGQSMWPQGRHLHPPPNEYVFWLWIIKCMCKQWNQTLFPPILNFKMLNVQYTWLVGEARGREKCYPYVLFLTRLASVHVSHTFGLSACSRARHPTLIISLPWASTPIPTCSTLHHVCLSYIIKLKYIVAHLSSDTIMRTVQYTASHSLPRGHAYQPSTVILLWPRV